MILQRERYPVWSQYFNATTSDVTFGLAGGNQQAPTTQSFLAYCKPEGSGEGTFGYLWARTSSASANGPRAFVDHGAGSPSFAFGGHSTGTAAQPSRQTALNSIVYGEWYHIAARWTGGLTGATDINIYLGRNGAPLSEPSYSAAGNGSTGSDGAASNNQHIGNREGTDRTFNGSIQYVARWNRVLTLPEFIKAQKEGPLTIPSGLILLWANGREWVNGFVPTTTAVSTGRPAPFRRLGPSFERRYFAPTVVGGGGAVPVFYHQLQEQGIA